MKNHRLWAWGVVAGTLLMVGGKPIAAAAQPAAPAIGVVTAASAGQFTLRTDAGSNVTVQVPSGILILRVPPGAKNLNSAVRIPASEITVGDRVLVRGNASSAQRSTLTATSIIVMTKTDIQKEHEAERLEWQKHGIAGVVHAVNPATHQITLAVPNVPPTPANPTHLVTLTLAPQATLLRYAPDSVKFSDAKPGTFDQIRPGDQVRALGALNPSGNAFTAREVVSGTFRNIGVTAISVNPANRTLKVKNLATGKPLLVRIDSDTKMHTLPLFVAMMIARFNSGNGGREGQAGAGAAHPRRATGFVRRGASAGGFRGGPGGPPGDFNAMLNRTPVLSLGSIKPGEPLIVVSTQGAKPGEVTAIAVLAGVAPILEARPKGSKQVRLGPWNLSIGGGGGGEGESGLSGGP